MNRDAYVLAEEVGDSDLIASYYCELEAGIDPYRKAEAFAIGQTTGTWTPVAGITDRMRKRHQGRVAGVTCLPPSELSLPSEPGTGIALIDIAFPISNFGDDLAMLITTLLGNDASTSTQAKLIDIRFPNRLLQAYGGPRFGIEGLRKLTKVAARPILLSMIKPCTGISPEAGADIFYHTALGGVDILKDDELLGDASFSSVIQRVEQYGRAAERVYEETGSRPVYAVNISGRPERMLSNLQKAVEAGARMVMVNYAAVGYACMQDVCARATVPVLGHYAGAGALFESSRSGMSSHLAMATLPRLAGADAAVICTPYGGYPLRREKYLKTVLCLTLPMGEIKSAMPAIGGRVHPNMVKKYVEELGQDIVLGAGGAIHGHPNGSTGGARAMRAAIEAVSKNEELSQAAEDSPDLRIALELWK